MAQSEFDFDPVRQCAQRPAAKEERTVPPTDPAERTALTEGVTLGAMEHLYGRGYACLLEVPLINSRRADIVALKENGTITIVEVKSGIEDFKADTKWPDYVDFADHFYFAFPVLRRDEAERAFAQVRSACPEAGLILADRFGGDILQAARKRSLNGTRRAAFLKKLAHLGARRSTSQILSAVKHKPKQGIYPKTEIMRARAKGF